MHFYRRRRDNDKGANLVEFAILMPFLILLLFGIVEFAWLFSQNLDVRHGAREGARLAAVNYPTGVTDGSGSRTDTDRDALIAEICSRMDTTSGVQVSLTSSGGVGDGATVTVDALADTLTGFIDWAIPSGLRLDSTVEIRLEQPATWSNASAESCP